MKFLKCIKFLLVGVVATESLAMQMQQPAQTKTFGITVDYLFWQALEDDLQYGVYFPGGIPSGGLASASQFSSIDQKFKPGSGVRIGATYSFCGNWDLGLSWTHFNKSMFGSVNGVPNSVAATGIFTLVENNIGSQANSDWRLKFNTIDLECGREISPIPSISVRPHLGVKGARINQEQNVNYGGVPTLTIAQVIKTNNFWAVGPRAGLDAQWGVWRWFSLLAGVSGSLMYGKFDVTSQFALSTATASASPLYIDKLYRVRPTSQMSLGFGVNPSICGFDFQLSAAYELQYWWNQWKNLPSPATVISAGIISNGDFMTHGLTLRLGLGF